jgi:hypothetical protein
MMYLPSMLFHIIDSMQQISCEKVHSRCPHFVESQASLLWSEEYAICLYSESDESTSRHSILLL